MSDTSPDTPSTKNTQEFYYTTLPPIPTAPQLDPFAYSPAEWKRYCWRLSPPICPECGYNFVRGDYHSTKTAKNNKFFCSGGCRKRWEHRLQFRYIPSKLKFVDWEGKSEGLSPPHLAEIHDAWSRARDKELRGAPGHITPRCPGSCNSYPTQSFPLRPDTRGKPCSLPAGWNTDHNGFGRCAHHGGNNPNARKAANKERAALELRESSMLFGEAIEVTPEEAILQELWRTNGAVEWYRQKIETLASESGATTSTSAETDPALAQWTKMGITPSVWVQLYNEERDRLMNLAKTAANMGIEAKKIQIVEEQGRMLAAVLQTFLQHPRMGFTPQQLVEARDVVREVLSTLQLGSGTSSPAASRVVMEDGLTREAHDYIDAQVIEEPEDPAEEI